MHFTQSDGHHNHSIDYSKFSSVFLYVRRIVSLQDFLRKLQAFVMSKLIPKIF
jgi:hypothetical protein